MGKYEKWLSTQNEATQIYFRNQAKEDNKLIYLGMIPGFILGFVFANDIIKKEYSKMFPDDKNNTNLENWN